MIIEQNTKFDLLAMRRREVGKGPSRRSRKDGEVPAIIYGAGNQSLSVLLKAKEINKALGDEKIFTKILSITIDGNVNKVILRDIARHPCKNQIMHVDFQRIDEKKHIIINIPLHFVGGDVAPGVKIGGGLISHSVNEVKVKCLPNDLPEFITVDMSKMELNQTLHLSDLPMPKNVEVVGLVKGEASDKPVVRVYLPKAVEEVEEKPMVASAEVKSIADEKREAREVKDAAAPGEKATETPKVADKKPEKDKK